MQISSDLASIGHSRTSMPRKASKWPHPWRAYSLEEENARDEKFATKKVPVSVNAYATLKMGSDITADAHGKPNVYERLSSLANAVMESMKSFFFHRQAPLIELVSKGVLFDSLVAMETTLRLLREVYHFSKNGGNPE
jgi:hypothetical protein